MRKNRLAGEDTRYTNLVRETIQDVGGYLPGMHHICARINQTRRKRSAVTHGQPNKSLRRDNQHQNSKGEE